uniref:Anaphase-promoting complex subunit 10 n=1 Tax=Elaeophora elaphi TaxID=1147741 RepID=A0A0R3S1R7_9BILA
MEVDENDALENQTPKKDNATAPWMASLPKNNIGDVRDISNQAFWTLSSCKTDGFGIQQLLDDDLEQYWQSDGPQPHTVTIEFSKKTNISYLLLYLDYKTDESYTPSKVVVRLGSSVLDVDEGLTVVFSEPVGWQGIFFKNLTSLVFVSCSVSHIRKRFESSFFWVIDLRDADGGPSRAFVLQLQVVQNHQNGRDTHIRQMRIIGPTRARLDTGIKTLINAGTNISNVPLKFTSQKIAQFANIR